MVDYRRGGRVGGGVVDCIRGRGEGSKSHHGEEL